MESPLFSVLLFSSHLTQDVVRFGILYSFRLWFQRLLCETSTLLCYGILISVQKTFSFSFPGIHADASRWLVKNRNIKLVGIDTASIDYGQSKLFESHRILYKENIPGLENVANMDRLPVKGFTVYAAPMFISGGSGGPCRVFALLDCA